MFGDDLGLHFFRIRLGESRHADGNGPGEAGGVGRALPVDLQAILQGAQSGIESLLRYLDLLPLLVSGGNDLDRELVAVAECDQIAGAEFGVLGARDEGPDAEQDDPCNEDGAHLALAADIVTGKIPEEESKNDQAGDENDRGLHLVEDAWEVETIEASWPIAQAASVIRSGVWRKGAC